MAGLVLGSDDLAFETIDLFSTVFIETLVTVYTLLLFGLSMVVTCRTI